MGYKEAEWRLRENPVGIFGNIQFLKKIQQPNNLDLPIDLIIAED